MQAFVWCKGRYRDLPAPPGWTSSAADINDRGDVIGVARIGPDQGLPTHPVLWREGVPLDLLTGAAPTSDRNAPSTTAGRWQGRR